MVEESDKAMIARHEHVMDGLSIGPCRPLFYIERSIDTEIVVYRAKREGNKLARGGVEVHWSDCTDLEKKVELSKQALDMFFGVECVKTPNASTYDMSISAMSDRMITLHLKKKKNMVVAKAVLDGKQARLLKIRVNIDKSILGIPNVYSLVAYGLHKGEVVEETIEVTKEIRGRFDMASLVSKLPMLLNFN